ncbi:MAG: hypothetical protein KBS63_04240 [Clostridiales bacterium]|nr:hypothetical protein [Candidatus Crickella caballi]
MNKRKVSAPASNIGIASLLVVFLVLCLVVFATLSLSTALNDYSQSQKQAQHVTEYYEGDANGN